MTRNLWLVLLVGGLLAWGCSDDKGGQNGDDAGEDAREDAGNGDPGPGDPGPGDPGPGDPGPGDPGPGDPGPGDPGPGDPGPGDPGPGDPGPGDAGDGGGCSVSEASCSDGVDDDCDGYTDCDDTDCAITGCGLAVVGGFHLAKGTDWSIVYSGHQIYSAPNPGDIFAITHHGRWFNAYTAGDCYFMAELLPGFCTPACGAGEWCTPNDFCEALPVPHHAGTVTIGGLTVPVSLQPDGNGLYPDHHMSQGDTFTSASAITVTASGGPTSAFGMAMQGVDRIDPPIVCDPNLPPAGQDLVFTWTPGPGDSWVRLTLPTWHHAGMGSAVVCEVQDTGVLVVPAAMIDYYLGAGAVPERTYNIARFNRAVADVGNGHAVAVEVTAAQWCDYFH